MWRYYNDQLGFDADITQQQTVEALQRIPKTSLFIESCGSSQSKTKVP